ncbi:transmembrane protein, putative (macronuclear) [Tetrahymena thermophila SB210]|uniref:Transmembrane protein, putative n=1 Tax=Tetrahymena thermophila (strain SB210) TaxID=312017 RepID=W7X420_TETTS|nr:transmembrane protein, putative [Tetrahymena thermophila SB210]EWS74060.1 transmembrane protein, putative [Tetrahymena thermophila SB210]|eukprot:XP_012653393.1 transmembrane protein, putative [Tetrahymena thermophila SB210]
MISIFNCNKLTIFYLFYTVYAVFIRNYFIASTMNYQNIFTHVSLIYFFNYFIPFKVWGLSYCVKQVFESWTAKHYRAIPNSFRDQQKSYCSSPATSQDYIRFVYFQLSFLYGKAAFQTIFYSSRGSKKILNQSTQKTISFVKFPLRHFHRNKIACFVILFQVFVFSSIVSAFKPMKKRDRLRNKMMFL